MTLTNLSYICGEKYYCRIRRTQPYQIAKCHHGFSSSWGLFMFIVLFEYISFSHVWTIVLQSIRLLRALDFKCDSWCHFISHWCFPEFGDICGNLSSPVFTVSGGLGHSAIQLCGEASSPLIPTLSLWCG